MRKLHLAAAMASAMALAAPASAGFFDFTIAPYIGIGAGQSKADLSCPSGTTCDDTGFAGKIYGGLEVNEYISMELGYVDLGKFSYSGAKSGTRKVKGVTAQVVGTYVVSPSITLIGKGGFGILDTSLQGTIAGPSGDVGDNDLEWSLGLGAQYNFTKSTGLRLEWERYHKVGSPLPLGTGEVNINLLTAGVVYKF